MNRIADLARRGRGGHSLSGVAGGAGTPTRGWQLGRIIVQLLGGDVGRGADGAPVVFDMTFRSRGALEPGS